MIRPDAEYRRSTARTPNVNASNDRSSSCSVPPAPPASPASPVCLAPSASPAPPACSDAAAWALFLDFDGTLIDLAATPDAVVIPPRLRPVLAACAGAFGGAVALVSGRPIAALDALLDPLRLPAAGLHGLERRLPDGTVEHAARRGPGLRGLRARLEALVREDGRLLLEDKGSSLALHFRRAPERERALRALVTDAAPRHDGYRILHGKMVVEVKSAHANKGDAIVRYLEAPPFAGRRPVFAGDDVTDEDGFDAVNRLGGISVKVGAGETRAACRAPDTDALLDWLAAVAGVDGTARAPMTAGAPATAGGSDRIDHDAAVGVEGARATAGAITTAGGTPAVPGHLDSRFRGNDGGGGRNDGRRWRE